LRGEHFFAVFESHEFGVGVLIGSGGGAVAESEDDALLFEIGAVSEAEAAAIFP